MNTKTPSGLRGMPDLLPPSSVALSRLEALLGRLSSEAGFLPVRLPILEETALFVRGVGAYTDIAQKELYTLSDRNDERISLRPEGTAGFMRAVLEHHLARQGRIKAWYCGPMFRYERPQKGRLRQFTQFGIEHVGDFDPALAVLELLSLSARFFEALELEGASLCVNTLGGAQSRTAFKASLVEFLKSREDALDPDSKTRLSVNPLRILDSKDPSTQALLQHAPKLLDFLSKEERDAFETLRSTLSAMNIPHEFNPNLVRGLDYYNDIVFEWSLKDDLGAQNAILGGGQYDALAQDLGGAYPLKAVGLAVGLERLLIALEARKAPLLNDLTPAPHAYLVLESQSHFAQALKLQHQLLRHRGLRLEMTPRVKSLKTQLKDADQSGAGVALLFLNDHATENLVQYKPLRGGEPEALSLQEAQARLEALISREE